MAGELDRGYGDEPDRTVVAGNKLLVKDFGPARAAVRLCEQRLSSRRILGCCFQEPDAFGATVA
jgi:hypothetical protein